MENFLDYAYKNVNQEKMEASKLLILFLSQKYPDVYRTSIRLTQICNFIVRIVRNQSEIGILYANLFGMSKN